MVLAGILFWITSLTMHKFIMKHPQIMNICKYSPFYFFYFFILFFSSLKLKSIQKANNCFFAGQI